MTTAAPPSTKPSRRGPLTYILSGGVALLLGAVAYKFWSPPVIGIGVLPSGIGVLPSLRIFVELYLGWLIAVMLGLAGITAMLIGIIAAGVRVGMRSSGRPTP